MDHVKVFKSTGALMLVLPLLIGSIIFVKVLMIIGHTPISLELFMLILLECFIVICLLASLQAATTQIYVTQKEVISKDIFSTEVFPLSSISIVKKINRGRSGTAILIEMDNSTSEIIGSALAKKEEVCSYILMQIRLHYPERYESIRSKSWYDSDKIY